MIISNLPANLVPPETPRTSQQESFQRLRGQIDDMPKKNVIFFLKFQNVFTKNIEMLLPLCQRDQNDDMPKMFTKNVEK